MKKEKVFDAEKANAFARALNDEQSNQLATKPDLIQMENRIIKWMVGLVLASTAIYLTVIGYLMSILLPVISQSTAVG